MAKKQKQNANFIELNAKPRIKSLKDPPSELQTSQKPEPVTPARTQFGKRAAEWVKGRRRDKYLLTAEELEKVEFQFNEADLSEDEHAYLQASRALNDVKQEQASASSASSSTNKPIDALSRTSIQAVRNAETLRRQVQPENLLLTPEHLLAGLNEVPQGAASAILSASAQNQSRLMTGLGERMKWHIPPGFKFKADALEVKEPASYSYSAETLQILEDARRFAEEKEAPAARRKDPDINVQSTDHTSLPETGIRPRHLMLALLSNDKTEAYKWMVEAGVPTLQVRQTLLQTPETQEITSSMFAFAPGVASADLTAQEDALGFKLYAQALAEIIIKKETVPPVVFGIYGPWGSGKSTFMSFVKQYLEEWDSGVKKRPKDKGPYPNLLGRLRDKWESFRKDLKNSWTELKRSGDERSRRYSAAMDRFIWGDRGKGEPVKPSQEVPKILCVSFDAWAYTDSNRLWVGLVQTISEKLDEHIAWWKRPLYWLKRTSWQFLGAFLLSLLPLIGAVAFAYLWPFKDTNDYQSLVKTVAGLFGFLSSFKLVNDKKPLTDIVQKELDKLDRSEIDGVINRIQKQLHSTVENYFKLNQDEADTADNTQAIVRRQKKLKLVVFIDELDRCPLEKIVDILESIKLFLAEDIFIVLMAVDTRVAAEAIRLHYKEVKNPNIAHEYLEKIIQVPIPVPNQKDNLTTYLESMMSISKGEQKKGNGQLAGPNGHATNMAGTEENSASHRDPIQVSDEPFKPYNLEDTLAEQQTIIDFSREYLDGNPRRIKRLLNTYRYVKILATRQGEPTHREAWQKQTIQWLGATMCWPEFMKLAIMQAKEKASLDDTFWADVAKANGEENSPPNAAFNLFPVEKKQLASLVILADNFIEENPPALREKKKEESQKSKAGTS